MKLEAPAATGLGLAVACLLAGCALQPTHPDAFSFGVLGDLPYNDHESVELDRLIAAMNAEALAFVVHVGDIKAPEVPCTEALLAERKAQFQRSRHAFVYTPGDNEWVDCGRAASGRRDALENLARIRDTFFADGRFLGAAAALIPEVMHGCLESLAGACRCAAPPENRRWTIQPANVVFATLNVTGGNDNMGRGAATDREAECRRLANRRWLEETFADARRGARAVVVIFHANPFVASRQGVFDALREAIAREAREFARPVLVIHGDTHFQHVDRPFAGADGRPVDNLLRLETFGSPFTGWVRVTADPNDRRFFRFETRGSD